MKEGNRYLKTDKELCDASIHVYHEIMMLNEVPNALPSYPDESIIHDALVESFVIHARVLIDFLYGYPNKDPKKHDIIAREFLDSSNSWPSKPPGDLKEVKERADKLAAHLTYDRISLPKNWECNKIRTIINEMFRKFRDQVPQDRIGDKLRNYKVPNVKTNGSPALVSTGTACTNGIKVSLHVRTKRP
jgi:hypothetical protein